MIVRLVPSKCSRSDGLEADGVGIDSMTQAGYDSSAMLGVMRVLAGTSRGGATPVILSTDPYPEQRVAEIKRYLASR